MATSKSSKASDQTSLKSSLRNIFTVGALVISLVVAYLFYFLFLGNPAHFEGNDPVAGHPIDGNMWGTIYKGGYVVGVNIALLIITFIFSIERAFTIAKAGGKGNGAAFLQAIKRFLDKDDVEAAIRECDRQRGSLGNVIRAGLVKYRQVEKVPDMDKEQKVVAIQKELEEAVTLELPMLQRNLVIISTVASVATLMGLLGTVLGMIKAFSALATAGAPDAVSLSTGISEALINTALGVGISALAIILYNTFSSTIDSLTYKMDEGGFTITQSFASKHSNAPAAAPAIA